MALRRIGINVEGEQQLLRAFRAMDVEMQDLRAPLAGVAEVLKRSVEGQFQSGGSRGGTPWPNLSPKYAAWKDAHYPGRPMMVRSATLRGALLSGNSGTIELGRERLVWGVPDSATSPEGTPAAVYAQAHQTGTGNMPARPIIKLTLADRRAMERVFSEWLVAIRRAPWNRAA